MTSFSLKYEYSLEVIHLTRLSLTRDTSHLLSSPLESHVFCSHLLKAAYNKLEQLCLGKVLAKCYLHTSSKKSSQTELRLFKKPHNFPTML